MSNPFPLRVAGVVLLMFATAAAAAKINAQIQAKKGIQHVDVPPIRSVYYPSTSSSLPKLRLIRLQLASPTGKASSPGASGSSTSNINGDMYIADGDYIKDIEVNDLRNRYTLTKGSTQKMVNTLVIPTDNPRHILYEYVTRANGVIVLL